MAQRVNLSPTGLPVQIKAFLAKTPGAGSSPKGGGQMSELGVMGLPVRIRSFSAKTEAVDTGGTGFYIKIKRRYR